MREKDTSFISFKRREKKFDKYSLEVYLNRTCIALCQLSIFLFLSLSLMPFAWSRKKMIQAQNRCHVICWKFIDHVIRFPFYIAFQFTKPCIYNMYEWGNCIEFLKRGKNEYIGHLLTHADKLFRKCMRIICVMIFDRANEI